MFRDASASDLLTEIRVLNARAVKAEADNARLAGELEAARRDAKVGSDRAKALGSRLENVARMAAREVLRHAGTERAPQAAEWVKHAVAFVRSLVEAGANDDAIKKAEDERDAARGEAKALREVIEDTHDTLDNLCASLVNLVKLPDAIHVRALREALPRLRDDIATRALAEAAKVKP